MYKKRAFFFSLKTWLTTVVAAPILFTIWSYDKAAFMDYSDAAGYIAYWILYGLIFSLPGFLIMLFWVFYVRSKEWRTFIRKGLIIAGAMVVTVLIFYFMFGWGRVFSQTEIWKIEVIYTVITIAGIVCYRLE